MKIGSEEHKDLFCRSLMTSHRLYEPEQLPWPDLDGQALARLRSIPFWEEALNTELSAGAKVNSFTETITDPLIREAIALQGLEEARHGRLFRFLIARYGVEISGRPPAALPQNIESGFIQFGYGECLDSFLGFGMFKIARQANFLPEPLFEIFDILLQEEARHVVFFVNWVAYNQANQGRGVRPLRAMTSLWHYGQAVKGLFKLASNTTENVSNDFSATDASELMDDFSLEQYLTDCLQENTRRMNEFDSRLLQPRFLPTLASFALFTFRLLPKRQNTSIQSQKNAPTI